MPHPLLYEINTRCWLRSLSVEQGRAVTLADVPDTEFDRWQKLGFTHIWAMGVWTTGPRSRAHALDDAGMRQTFAKLLPDWRPDDTPGSPYAIADYRVPASLGGESGLAAFRKRLNARGLKLLLDFVPNHFGLDHPWITEKPELFMLSPAEVAGTFPQQTVSGLRWLAHGKDPNFAPWADTVQINYRRPETRAAKITLLQTIAARCDGVRCDMAMLMLNDVFARTWAHIPEQVSPPTSEFWAEAIPAVKKTSPDFLFLAEVYWGLEARLQSLGFDYTYNKMVFDSLRDGRSTSLQESLLAAPRAQLEAGAHFLENHDERRIASVLSPAEHRAAALLMLGLPGMRFLYEGQLQGRQLQIPVQLGRWPDEPVNPEILAMYEQLLVTLKDTAVGRGEVNLLQPIGWPDNHTAPNFVIIHWQESPSKFDLVVVNLAPHPSQCRVQLPVKQLAAHDWLMRNLLGAENYRHSGAELAASGLHLDVPAHAAQLFQFTKTNP